MFFSLEFRPCSANRVRHIVNIIIEDANKLLKRINFRQLCRYTLIRIESLQEVFDSLVLQSVRFASPDYLEELKPLYSSFSNILNSMTLFDSLEKE